MSHEQSPLIIGRTEYIALPRWGIFGLRAKIDTGARSSALHVEQIELLPQRQVAFDVVIRQKGKGKRTRVSAQIIRESFVRSSTGERDKRLFVETTLRLGPIERRIEISLVDRAAMIHRMLLGRNALTGPILIDVNSTYRLGRPKKPSTKKKHLNKQGNSG
ncbi:MAG: ATP-dependent zinc protease [Trueperaceae bacterium]|nr:MAG: ATP-dependent zinc protease [Trueperaceae bacterium]